MTEAATGAPLAGAHILAAGTQIGALADAEGRYTLPSMQPGEVHLIASFIGYTPVTRQLHVAASRSDTVDFRLSSELLPQEGIIVSARGRPSRLTALAGSAGLIDAPEIAGESPISIADAAGNLPGVAVGSDMPWGSRLQIRGLSRDHVVMLVDGNRVSTATEVAAQFGTVAPADVARVEVLKGPVSVLYGTGSTGGVVNIIPRSGRFTPVPQWELGLTNGYESVAGGLHGYGRIGFNAPRFYLLFSQSYRDYGSYRDGSGDRIANSQFRDGQSHLNLGIRLGDAHSLDFRYQRFEAHNVGIPGAGGVFPATAVVTYPETRRWLAEAAWTFRPGSPIWRQSRLKLFLQTVERRTRVLPDIVQYLPATDTQPLRRARPQSIAPAADHAAAGFRWNNQLHLNGHELVFGLEGWRKELASSRRRVTLVDVLRPDSSLVKTVESATVDRPLPQSTYRPLGLYLEEEFRPTPSLILNAGGRIDLIRVDNERTFRTYEPLSDRILWETGDDTDLSWNAQVRGTCALTEALDVYLNLAKSFRSPGLEERYLYVDLGSLVRIGDPTLDSEDGFFAESGASLRTGRLRWNGQLFYNRIDNLVIEQPATFEGRDALRKTNAGQALFVGVETDLALALHPRLLLAADLAYVRGTDEQEGLPLPAIAPLTGHLSLRYGAHLWYRAELELTAAQERVAPGEAITPGHATLDLSAGCAAPRTGDLRHRITIGLRNVLDAAYRDHLATWRGFALNAPGRSLFVNWTLER